MFFNADVRLADPELFFRRMGSIICDESVSAATCNVLIYPEEEGTIDRLFHRFFNWYCRFLNEIGMGMGRGECHVIRAERFRRIGGRKNKKNAGADTRLFFPFGDMGGGDFVRARTPHASPPPARHPRPTA